MDRKQSFKSISTKYSQFYFGSKKVLMYAFVHDRIVHLGGAEKVLVDMIRDTIFHIKESNNNIHKQNIASKITIFTLYSNVSHITIDDTKIPIITAMTPWINNVFTRGSSIKNKYYKTHDLKHTMKIAQKESSGIHLLYYTTKLLLLSFFLKCKQIILSFFSLLFDYRNLIILYPLLTLLLRKKIQSLDPDIIIISSFAAVKNIVPPISEQSLRKHQGQKGRIKTPYINNQKNSSITVLYLHSPMQYIWENYDEYYKKMSLPQRIIFSPLARLLRRWDRKERYYDHIITNSQYTKKCAYEYYFNTNNTGLHTDTHQKIYVQYPKLHIKYIKENPAKRPRNYFLYIGRLVKFIRETDLVIRLCNHAKIPLIIIGSGPDEMYLKSLAGDTITFLGYIDDIDEKIYITKHARGLINLAKESCGIATMEALSLGVPVFGFSEGATPEFINNENGVLVQEKNMDHLIFKYRDFLHKEKTFDRKKIKEKFLLHYNMAYEESIIRSIIHTSLYQTTL